MRGNGRRWKGGGREWWEVEDVEWLRGEQKGGKGGGRIRKGGKEGKGRKRVAICSREEKEGRRRGKGKGRRRGGKRKGGKGEGTGGRCVSTFFFLFFQ